MYRYCNNTPLNIVRGEVYTDVYFSVLNVNDILTPAKVFLSNVSINNGTPEFVMSKLFVYDEIAKLENYQSLENDIKLALGERHVAVHGNHSDYI